MTTEDSVRALFGKLDTQLRNQQPKRALKTVEESELGPCSVVFMVDTI